ncbi:MAG: hypothetical protein HQL48_05560, partial [Gammaproteobacteria bacterium]|nr:hypothetical protein [Gammaproteobacteria bacterium]
MAFTIFSKKGVPSGADSDANGEQGPLPLSFRRRFGWGVELFKRNLGTMVALGIIFFILSIAAIALGIFAGSANIASTMMSLSMAGSSPGAPPNPLQLFSTLFDPLTLLAMGGGFLLSLLFLFWFQGASFHLPAASLVSGERAGILAAMKSSLRRLPDFINAISLLALFTLLAQLAFTLIGSAIGGMLWWLLASFLFTIWLSLTLILAAPIAILENRGPLDILSRAWELAEGIRLRMLGHFILLGLVTILLFLLVMVPIWLLSGLLGGGLIIALLSLITSFLLYFFITFQSLFFIESFYFEARVVKEGWRPGWSETPEESWILSSGEDDYSGEGRGWRGWGELLLITLILVAINVGGYLLLVQPNLNSATEVNQFSFSSQTHTTPYTSPVVTPPLSQSLPTLQGDGSPVGVTARLVRDVFFEQQDSASFWIKVAVEGAVIPEEGSDPGKV